MKIASHTLAPKSVFVIAELGVNHNGALPRALEMVDTAADAGADAIKTQYFVADDLLSKAARLASYQQSAGEADPADMLARLELSLDDHAKIIRRAHQRGLAGIITVFSAQHVDAVTTVGCDAFKTASPDVVNKPLLDALIATDHPLLISTGAATLDEIARTVGWLGQARKRTALMQCVSAYPVQPDGAALDGIDALAQLFDGPIGYSDHTTNTHTGAKSVAHDARILEKHFTLDRTAPGPDHAASLEPDQFAEYVSLARQAAKQPTTAHTSRPAKCVLDSEREVRRLSRQSIVSAHVIRQGDVVRSGDLTIKRPGTGIEPWRLVEVIGKTAARTIEPDMPIVEEDLT